jgi:hypothetical protein
VTKGLATALLYLVCLFSVPCFYFVVLAAGICPVSVMFGVAVAWLWKSGSEPAMGMLGLLSVLNVAVWGALLFLLCRWTIRVIYSRFPRDASMVAMATVAGVACIGLLPIFWIAGHGTPTSQSAYALLFDLMASRW